MLQLQLTCDCF